MLWAAGIESLELSTSRRNRIAGLQKQCLPLDELYRGFVRNARSTRNTSSLDEQISVFRAALQQPRVRNRIRSGNCSLQLPLRAYPGHVFVVARSMIAADVSGCVFGPSASSHSTQFRSPDGEQCVRHPHRANISRRSATRFQTVTGKSHGFVATRLPRHLLRAHPGLVFQREGGHRRTLNQQGTISHTTGRPQNFLTLQVYDKVVPSRAPLT